MTTSRIKFASPGRIAAAALAALLVCSAGFAQDKEKEKEKKSGRNAPAHQEHRQAPAESQQPREQTRPAAETPRQAPAQPQNAQPGRRFGQGAPAEPARPAYTPRPNVRVEPGQYNRQVVHAPNGSQVHMAGGRVVEVHTPGGAVIRHAPDGVRRVEVVRPGNRVVVVNGRGGYVQRPLVIMNRPMVTRTYVVGGAVVTRVYRPYTIRPGIVVNVYTPVRYYRPAFYVYAYHPWARPVYYNSWGWVGTPWFGFYAGYFAPAPYYPGPAYWLTDYMIAAMLQQEYLDRMAAQAPPPMYAGTQTPLSPEVRQEIADEVSRQLHAEQDAAQAGGMAADVDPFAGGTHVFVVGNAVEAQMGPQSCPVTAGDVLAMQGPPPPGASAANVLVKASKGGDCPMGSVVTVGLQDLAEMQNRMREEVDRGLAEMQAKQGQGGIPPMPADAAAPATPVSWASQVQPDPTAQAEVTQVSADASREEQQAVSGALQSEGQAPPQPTGNIALGSSVEDVVAAFGQPLRTADLGSKKIYIYKDVKVTFQDGKVIDVQ